MKAVGLILVILLAFSGCATFNHSESIDTDQLGGFASGKYQLSGSGPNYNVCLSGGGGGWGASAVRGGLGAAAIAITTGPANVNALNFARSIAQINYSKRLKSVTYDEAGGIIDYEFEPQPLTKVTPTASKSRVPSSFGYAPVE